LHFIFGADAGVSGLSLDFRGARVRGEIQLLLTDVIMPKLRGPELAARLRMRYPSLKVIFMSGYTENALVQGGMLERNTVLLQKPFTVKQILQSVQLLNVTAGR